MKRLAAMQDWPLLIVRALTAVRTAASRSALGITMNGSLPPSSSTVFLITLPAALRDVAAGAVAAGERHRRDPRILDDAASPGRSRSAASGSTPSGKPARRKISSIASAHCGTFDACLSRPTLPAMSAGAAKRKTCQNGKFHGITASTGPIGW